MYRRNPPGLHVRSLLPPCHEVSQVSQIRSAGELQAGFTLSLHASPALPSSMWWTVFQPVCSCHWTSELRQHLLDCASCKRRADTVPIALHYAQQTSICFWPAADDALHC